MYPEALKIAQVELANARKKQFATGEIKAYQLIGQCKKFLDDYAGALQAFRAALRKSEIYRRDSLVQKTLIFTGALEAEWGKPMEAMNYYQQALPIARRLSDKRGQAQIYINIANALDDMGRPDSAILYNIICDSLLKNTPFEAESGHNCYGLGDRYYERFYSGGNRQDIRLARTYFLKALEYFEKLGFKRETAATYNALGAISSYFPEDALRNKRLLQKSIQLYSEIKDTIGLIRALYNMSEVDRARNDLDSAQADFKQFKQLLDSTGRKENLDFMLDYFLEAQDPVIRGKKLYEIFVTKETDILDSQKAAFQAEMQKNKAEKQKIIYALSLLVVALFALTAVIGAVYYRDKMRSQQRIMQQEIQLFQQKIENQLHEKEREMENVRREVEETTRSKIADDLHDDVGSLLAATRWLLEMLLEKARQVNNPLTTGLSNALNIQQEAYVAMRNIAHQMERDPVPWWESLSHLCSKIPRVHFAAHGVDETLGGLLGEEPRLIVRELLANALKHAKANRIDIQIIRLDDQLSIMVGDDGIGITPTSEQSGMGARTILERVKRLNGKIEYDIGRGLTVFVDIPIPRRAA